MTIIHLIDFNNTMTTIFAHQLISEMKMILLYPAICSSNTITNEYQCRKCDQSFSHKYILKIYSKIHSPLVISLMYFAFVCWSLYFSSVNAFNGITAITIALILSFIVTINSGYKCRKYLQMCSSIHASAETSPNNFIVLYLSIAGVVIMELKYVIAECAWWLMIWIAFGISTYYLTHQPYLLLVIIALVIFDTCDSFSGYFEIFKNTIKSYNFNTYIYI